MFPSHIIDAMPMCETKFTRSNIGQEFGADIHQLNKENYRDRGDAQ